MPECGCGHVLLVELDYADILAIVWELNASFELKITCSVNIQLSCIHNNSKSLIKITYESDGKNSLSSNVTSQSIPVPSLKLATADS